MCKSWLRKTLCALPLVAALTNAQAIDFADDRIHLNLFGTFGLATLSEPDAKLLRSGSGASVTRHTTSDFDSRLGIQLSGDINDNISLFWQGLISRDSENATVNTKWAFVKLQPKDWLDVKIGRFMVPFYQISEQMYVGYAHPWVRAPLEIYDQLALLDTNDGIWARLYLPTTSFRSSLELSAARSNDQVDDIKIKTQPIYTGVLNLGYKDLSFRAMAARVTLNAKGESFSALNTLLNDPSASNHYNFLEGKAWYYNLGMTYQNLDWYVSAEYVKTSTDKNNYAIGDTEIYTSTIGHYWGNFLPFLSYSKLRSLDLNPETGLTGLAQATAQFLIDDRRNDQSTVSAGMRWDFHPGYALKAQVDRTDVKSGHRGLFAAEPKDNVYIYSLAVEMVL